MYKVLSKSIKLHYQKYLTLEITTSLDISTTIINKLSFSIFIRYYYCPILFQTCLHQKHLNLSNNYQIRYSHLPPFQHHHHITNISTTISPVFPPPPHPPQGTLVEEAGTEEDISERHSMLDEVVNSIQALLTFRVFPVDLLERFEPYIVCCDC